MFEMAKNSIILFARGKLFKNIWSVFGMAFVGVIITAALFLGFVYALPGIIGWALPETVWLSAALAAMIGGFVQPYLFKDLKYA